MVLVVMAESICFLPPMLNMRLPSFSLPMAIDSSFADKMIEMTDAMVPYSPSMKLDFDNHRPMEIPYLYSRPISEARKVGFDMSKLAMLEAELQFIQDSYLKK